MLEIHSTIFSGRARIFLFLRDAQVFRNQWRKQTPSGATFKGLALEPRSLERSLRFALDGERDEVWRHHSCERAFSTAGDDFTCSEVEAMVMTLYRTFKL